MLTSQKLTLKDICRSDVVSDLYLVWRTHFQLVQYQTAWALEKSFFFAFNYSRSFEHRDEHTSDRGLMSLFLKINMLYN